jgi:hypothetical protein
MKISDVIYKNGKTIFKRKDLIPGKCYRFVSRDKVNTIQELGHTLIKTKDSDLLYGGKFIEMNNQYALFWDGNEVSINTNDNEFMEIPCHSDIDVSSISDSLGNMTISSDSRRSDRSSRSDSRDSRRSRRSDSRRSDSRDSLRSTRSDRSRSRDRGGGIKKRKLSKRLFRNNLTR